MGGWGRVAAEMWGKLGGQKEGPLLGPTENCEAEGVTPKGRRQGWQGSGQSPSSE